MVEQRRLLVNWNILTKLGIFLVGGFVVLVFCLQPITRCGGRCLNEISLITIFILLLW